MRELHVASASLAIGIPPGAIAMKKPRFLIDPSNSAFPDILGRPAAQFALHGAASTPPNTGGAPPCPPPPCPRVQPGPFAHPTQPRTNIRSGVAADLALALTLALALALAECGFGQS